MSEKVDAPRHLTLCAACGLPLQRRTAICPSCGALAPFERLMTRVSRLAGRVPRDRDLRFRVILWTLAVFPLLFIPPLAAIAVAWSAWGRASDRRFDPTWITIVAILNLVVSAGLIHRFGPDLLALLSNPTSLLWSPQHHTTPGLQSI